MRFREPLPQDCPPAGAAEILAPREVFRLVREDPPSDGDFASQRELSRNVISPASLNAKPVEYRFMRTVLILRGYCRAN